MAGIMLALGDFRFSIDTAAYDALSRSHEYRWEVQERLGRKNALQYMGPGAETISLDGTIYPQYRGGLGQLDSMRAEADKGAPLLLVDGRGLVWGEYVIRQIDEGQSAFFDNGAPRKITFKVALEAYGEDLDQRRGYAVPADIIGQVERRRTLQASGASVAEIAAAEEENVDLSADENVGRGSFSEFLAAVGNAATETRSAVSSATESLLSPVAQASRKFFGLVGDAAGDLGDAASDVLGLSAEESSMMISDFAGLAGRAGVVAGLVLPPDVVAHSMRTPGTSSDFVRTAARLGLSPGGFYSSVKSAPLGGILDLGDRLSQSDDETSAARLLSGRAGKRLTTFSERSDQVRSFLDRRAAARQAGSWTNPDAGGSDE